MEATKIRILVLDDQPLLRYGISAYLNSQPDMMVCLSPECPQIISRTLADFDQALKLNPAKK